MDPAKTLGTPNTGKVAFSIMQNATAHAVIDPAHLVFKFSGKDIEGRAMATDGDEFDGFGKVF